MLIFVAFPAMKVTDWFEDTFGIDTKWHNIIMFSLVILFSLCIGIFLKFA
ncbi:MAG: hypothetical protein JJV88_03890 [Sulfurovum sp.]|nr:hypothetical protein [Sulfurovaceae bacterium]